MRVFFQDRHPILNVGRAALRVVSHAHLLSGHHGADLRPQFLAGILRAPKSPLPFLILRRLLRPVLVEQHLCSLLSPAHLPAQRRNLPVGSPTVVSPALADLAAHEIQAVASGVGFAGGYIRRSDLFPRLPGLLPGRGAFFDLLDDFTTHLLGVCLAPLIVALLRWPFCHAVSLRLSQL